MAIERTFSMIKPDATKRNLTGAITKMLEDAGLRVVASKRVWMSRREAEGYRVATIYHSHIDTGAYFSETDKRNALVDGEPAYPDAVYVVISVMGGRPNGANAFAWDPARRDFLPLEFTVPASAQ